MRFRWMTCLRVTVSDQKEDERIWGPMSFPLIGSFLALMVASSAHPISLAPLGDLPGGEVASSAAAVSADGAIVVGTSASTLGTEAFIWDAVNGMRGLGDLPGGEFFSSATAVSADGSIVVGYSRSASGEEAFIWDVTNGMQALGDLPGGYAQSRATAVSADGAIVVGQAESGSGTEAFIWDAVDGMRGLGDLPGGPFFSSATAVSGDGSIVVGLSTISFSYRGDEAFIWDAFNGMRGIGALPGRLEFFSEVFSRSDGVSADGSTVIGQSAGASGDESFIWDADNGMRTFGELPGGSPAYRVTSISSDGWFLIGHALSPQEAFIWDPINGIRGLGFLPGSEAYSDATGISADGAIVVGTSTSSLGQQAFIASIPEGRDTDGDGTSNHADNCPRTANPDQMDEDSDGVGDTCTHDRDEDGAPDVSDNCFELFNPDQMDADSNGLGDACNNPSDPDRDEWELLDNCPTTPNPDQADTDTDGRGDACNSSYQRTDGTIVYPITSAACGPFSCNWYGSAVNPFLGPALAPGVKISGSHLDSADLRDADLRESDLRGVSILGSDISRGDLRGADMRNMELLATHLSSADLDHVDLRGAMTSYMNLMNVDLRSAKLHFQCSDHFLWGADLSNATLRNSTFFHEACFLGNASFENADLRGSIFGYYEFPRYMNGADVRGATFLLLDPNHLSEILGSPYYDSTTVFQSVSSGDLYSAPASWINLDEVDVDGDGTADSTDSCRFAANVDQLDADADGIGNTCDFSPSTTCLEMGALARSTTTLAALQDNTCEDWSWVEQPAANLQSAVLTETYLRSANLSGAVMTQADLAGADLTSAQLVNTYLGNANLDSAVLAYAHLAFANLSGANLAHADLESADVSNVLLTFARYDEATVFPSGRNFAEPPWGLTDDVTPWDAGMIPVPEPGLFLLAGSGALSLNCLSQLRRKRRSRFHSDASKDFASEPVESREWIQGWSAGGRTRQSATSDNSTRPRKTEKAIR